MKSQTKNPRARRALAAAAILGITHSAAHAAIVSWNAPGGGAWSNLTWTGGVGTSPPQSIDTAAFNLNNTYNVNLNVSPTIFLVQVGGSNVTFIGSSGATVTSTGGLSVSSGSFTLAPSVPVTWNNGNTIFFNANATVSNGSDMTAPGMGVGSSGAATATFTGTGTTLTLSGGIGVGNGNAGILNFSNSAAASTTAISVATSGTGSGSLNVQSNAALASTGAITIGAASGSPANMTLNGGTVTASGGDLNVNSSGVLDIQVGGNFSIANRAVFVNSGSKAEGKIKVGGAGESFAQTGNVATSVGSGSGNLATVQTNTGGIFSTGTAGLTVNATGVVDVAGGTFTLNGNASIAGTLQRSSTGSFDWAASRAMTIQTGGHVNFTGGYALPVSASVLIWGAGSSLVQSTSGALTVNNGSELNIANNATVDTFAVRVSDGAAGLVNHSGGTHSISGGTNPLILGNSAGATGTYNLSGGGLWITNNQAGAGTIVGNNGTGSFVQTGGWQWVTGSSAGVVIGAGPTGVGTYAISAGSLDSGPIQIGRDAGATGTLNVSTTGGGSTFVDATGNIEMGMTAGATGTINISSGFIGGAGLFVGGASAGPGGNGIVNITGGNVAISGPLRIWNNGTSAVNLSGGSLSCDDLITSGNPSRFSWTGNANLSITGNAGLLVAVGGPVGANVTLSNGRSLGVAKSTTIDGAGSIAVVGSGSFNTGGLFGAGSLSSDGNYMFIGTMNQNNGSGMFTGSLTGFGGISKYGTGTQSLRNTRISNVQIHQGRIAILPTGGNSIGTTVVSNLTIDNSCQLDLGDNKLIVTNGQVGSWNGSAYTGVTGMVQAGRGDGTWNGSGVVTSLTAATTSVLTTLAVGKASELGYAGGNFGGQSVAASDVLVMYTWGGDADLNGELNGDDYFFIDSNVLQSGNVFGFHNGDFDYNGEINGDDYFIIDSNILFAQNQLPFPTGAGAAAGLTAVPEPASLGLIVTLAACTRRRRSR